MVPTTMPLPTDLIDINAVARLWDCHVSKVYRQIHAGKLKAWKIAGRFRVSKRDAESHIIPPASPPGRTPLPSPAVAQATLQAGRYVR